MGEGEVATKGATGKMRKSEEEELLERISCYTHSTSNNITINNITNINVSGGRNPHWHRSRGGHGNRHRKSERPPKLTRHIASLGLLDGDIAYGIGTEERMREGGKVMAYGTKGAIRDAGRVARSTVTVATHLTRSIFGMVGLFACAVGTLIDGD